MIQNRGFQYVLYFTALLVIGIIDNKDNAILNPGPNELIESDSKIILIGSNEQLTDFNENVINDL